MLAIETIRTRTDEVRAAARDKGEAVDLDRLLALDAERRSILAELEANKAKRNAESKEIGRLAKSGGDASAKRAEMKALSEEIKAGEARLAPIEAELDRLMLRVPNLPAPDVPPGKDDSSNEVVGVWGEPPDFEAKGFKPRPHWDLASALDIVDFERGAKVAGSHFLLYKGAGAALERALISFMLDVHTRTHGYTELLPPFLASREAMVGTGQLPKLEEDMYRCGVDDLFLIPTAEVPLTNVHAGETLPAAALPVKYCAWRACFRREAGSYGADTRGMARVHQFNKVELVKLVAPESSERELDSLVGDAEAVLQRLGLHYRVVKLCRGELSFAAAKCYDIELWAPGLGRWLEVSSCSNFTDFQARRAKLRCRTKKNKSVFCHTLNGSGVATPRTFVALVESFQQADGSVTIPKPLRSYMGGVERIGPPTKP
jgi:seryl-tRNA synthetase